MTKKLICALGIAALIMGAGLVYAEGGKHNEDMMDQMTKELNLTPDQVQKLRSFKEEGILFRNELMQTKYTDDKEAIRAKVEAFKKSQHERLAKILTPEQMKKLEDNKGKHMGPKQLGQK